MNVSVDSQKTRKTLHRKAFERIEESKWRTSCKFIWIKHPWNTSHIPSSDLARTLFLFLSILPIQNWNNPPQSYRRWMYLRRNITYECLLSQSVVSLPSILNAVSDGVFKKMFNGETIFHLKRILKRLYCKWKTW